MILWLLLAVSQYDPNFTPKFAEATRLLDQKQYAEAVPILDELTKEHPDVGQYWLALGVAHAAGGNLDAAIQPFETGCKAKQRSSRACTQWGRVLHLANRFEDALKAFELVKKEEVDAAFYFSKAQSLEAVGRDQEADMSFRGALAESALRPANSAEIQLRYGVFLYRRGNMEAALWQYEQVVRKQPFWGAAWREKARALLQLKREKESAEALEQAVAHGERNRDNLLLLSRIYERMGDASKAETYRREALNP